MPARRRSGRRPSSRSRGLLFYLRLSSVFRVSSSNAVRAAGARPDLTEAFIASAALPREQTEEGPDGASRTVGRRGLGRGAPLASRAGRAASASRAGGVVSPRRARAAAPLPRRAGCRARQRASTAKSGHNRWSGMCSESWCFGRGATHERVTLYGPV